MVCLRYSIELVLFSTWVFESSFYLFYLQIFRFFIGWLVAGCHSTCLPSWWILQVWYTENRYPLKTNIKEVPKFYCWTFVGPFFYAIKIFILEHQNHSSLKFTDCKRRCGMWDSLCHSFSVTFSVIFFFASRFQLNVRRSPPSWDLVVWLFYIFYSYLLSWALFL